LHPDERFPPLCREAGKALQETFRTCHLKTGPATQLDVAFDSADHDSASGHGWAICFSKFTSALA
jgi:hypothetical protein